MLAVFQCSRCKTVLSDSQELVRSVDTPEDGVQCIVVRGVSEVHVDRIAHTAPDATQSCSCTHYSVCCASCGAAVGRLYTQAPPHVQEICNQFCLEVASCISYQLGSAEIRAPGSVAASAAAGIGAGGDGQQLAGSSGMAGAGAAAAAAAAAQGGRDMEAAPSVALALEVLQQRVEYLEASLCKLQGIQVLHDAQLQQLPHYQVTGDAGGDLAAAAAADS